MPNLKKLTCHSVSVVCSFVVVFVFSLLKSSNAAVSDGVVNTGTLLCLSLNNEIVRRSSLILFCDYVVSTTRQP
jgi:hypothetical protein